MKRIIKVLFAAFVLTLVPATYANAQWKDRGDFFEGLAAVKDANDKYGFINKTGKVVIPCKWRWARDFHEGLAAVVDANGKYGFINKTGKVVIPCQWRDADDFHEGLASVYDDN